MCGHPPFCWCCCMRSSPVSLGNFHCERKGEGRVGFYFIADVSGFFMVSLGESVKGGNVITTLVRGIHKMKMRMFGISVFNQFASHLFPLLRVPFIRSVSERSSGSSERSLFCTAVVYLRRELLRHAIITTIVPTNVTQY